MYYFIAITNVSSFILLKHLNSERSPFKYLFGVKVAKRGRSVNWLERNDIVMC